MEESINNAFEVLAEKLEATKIELMIVHGPKVPLDIVKSVEEKINEDPRVKVIEICMSEYLGKDYSCYVAYAGQTLKSINQKALKDRLEKEHKERMEQLHIPFLFSHNQPKIDFPTFAFLG